MEIEDEFFLAFDVDHDDYESFIDLVREVLADHPDRNSDIRNHGDWLINHPLLPKEEPIQPARWIKIKLSVLDDKKEPKHTTLVVRGDNLYLTAFKNQDGKLFEFGMNDPEQQQKDQESEQKDHLTHVKGNKEKKKQKVHLSQVIQKQKHKKQKNERKKKPTDEPFFEDSDLLGYDSGYGVLVGEPVWEKIEELGKTEIRNAVLLLSAHRKSGPKGDKGMKKYLAKLIVIICESARMYPHMITVKNGWGHVGGNGSTLTVQHGDYMTCWEKMSRAMIGSDGYPPTLTEMGIKNKVDACGIVHLIKNSKKVKEAADKGHPKGKSGRPGEDATRKSDPPTKDFGNPESSQPGNDHDKDNMENLPKNHNGGGEHHRNQQSLSLMEVFAVRHTNSADEPFVGRIAIFDGRRGQIIYWNEQNEDVSPNPNNKGNLVLTGPYRAISAGGKVALKITANSVGRVVDIWDPNSESEYNHDELIHRKIYGDLELTYAALSSAVEATVQVDIFFFGNTSKTTVVYGDITVRSQLFEEEEANVVLFSCRVEENVELQPSYAGSTIPLARSVVLWPVDSQLVINVDKLRLTNEVDQTSDSPATRFTEQEFTFEDRKDRVCVALLKGIGYALLSVDDTGEHRDETSDSLPRSLRNKMNHGMSIENELLIFTFEPHNFLPCLLHLTNKSDDRSVAFRSHPGQDSPSYFNDISEISVILPPHSTSTYLVRLESPLPQSIGSHSLILQSCVVLEKNQEDEESKDSDEYVDAVFSMQTRAEIQDVELKATVPELAEKTTACDAPAVMVQMIPRERGFQPPFRKDGLGSHHSKRLEMDPLVTSPVILEFHIDHGEYNVFISQLREVLADHRDRDSDLLKYGRLVAENPLLPKNQPFRPARWIHIRLSAGSGEGEKHTTLAVRDDNLYLVGFMNQIGEWYEFGNDGHLLSGSILLGFPSNYGELLGGSRLENVNLGMQTARDAVFKLADHDHYGRQKGKDKFKVCLAKLMVMICESARNTSIMETVEHGWQSGTTISVLQVQYIYNWLKMSRAMMEWAPYLNSLKDIGIGCHDDARKVVHLIANSGSNRSLLEVFSVVDTADSRFVGTITVCDGIRDQIMYRNEETGDNPSKGNSELTGINRAISATGRVSLKITGKAQDDVHIVPIWDPDNTEAEDKYDKVLTDDIHRGLKLTYAVLRSARETNVQVDLTIAGNTDITADSQLPTGDKFSVVLYRNGNEQKVEPVPSPTGRTIPLTRSVVAWPEGSSLDINVRPHWTTATDEGTGVSSTTPVKFSFQDPTEKLHSVEGLGWVGISCC